MPSVEGSSKEPRMEDELRRQGDGQQPFLRVPSPARPHSVGGTRLQGVSEFCQDGAPPNSCGGPGGAPARSPAALHCVALGSSLTSFCPFSHLQNGDQMHLSHR